MSSERKLVNSSGWFYRTFGFQMRAWMRIPNGILTSGQMRVLAEQQRYCKKSESRTQHQGTLTSPPAKPPTGGDIRA